MCVQEWHLCAMLMEARKGVSGPLDLELKIAVSYMGVGMEPGPSVRANSASQPLLRLPFSKPMKFGPGKAPLDRLGNSRQLHWVPVTRWGW